MCGNGGDSGVECSICEGGGEWMGGKEEFVCCGECDYLWEFGVYVCYGAVWEEEGSERCVVKLLLLLLILRVDSLLCEEVGESVAS